MLLSETSTVGPAISNKTIKLRDQVTSSYTGEGEVCRKNIISAIFRLFSSWRDALCLVTAIILSKNKVFFCEKTYIKIIKKKYEFLCKTFPMSLNSGKYFPD